MVICQYLIPPFVHIPINDYRLMPSDVQRSNHAFAKIYSELLQLLFLDEVSVFNGRHVYHIPLLDLLVL